MEGGSCDIAESKFYQIQGEVGVDIGEKAKLCIRLMSSIGYTNEIMGCKHKTKRF